MDVSYRRSLDRKITNDIGELENVQFLLFGEMNYRNLERRNEAESMLDNLDKKEKKKYIDTCLDLIKKNRELNRVYKHLLNNFYPYLITLHKLEDVLKGKVRILCGSMNPGLGIDYLYSFKFPITDKYGSGTKIKNLYEKAMTMVYDLIQLEEDFWEILHKELIIHFMTVELPELDENRFKKLFSNDYNNDDSNIPMYIELCKDISKISDGWSDKEKINNICSKISQKISLAEVVADGCIFIMKDYSYERVKNRTITEDILVALEKMTIDVLDTSKSFLKSAAIFCKRKEKKEGGRRKKKTKKSKKKKRKSKKRRHAKKSRRR